MTDTKEFNKSLDRIAKALGGEEWSPEDKPEAIYKLLDKIADKLEENGTGGGSSGGGAEPFIIHLFNEAELGRASMHMTEKAIDILNAYMSGRVCLVATKPVNASENYYVDDVYASVIRAGYSVNNNNKIGIMFYREGSYTETWLANPDEYPSMSFD